MRDVPLSVGDERFGAVSEGLQLFDGLKGYLKSHCAMCLLLSACPTVRAVRHRYVPVRLCVVLLLSFFAAVQCQRAVAREQLRPNASLCTSASLDAGCYVFEKAAYDTVSSKMLEILSIRGQGQGRKRAGVPRGCVGSETGLCVGSET